MISKSSTYSRIFSILAAIGAFALAPAAQSSSAEKGLIDASGDRIWYILGSIAVAGIAVAYLLWRRSQKGKNKPQVSHGNRYKNYYNQSTDVGQPVAAEKDLEWLRKAKNGAGKSADLTFEMKTGRPDRRRRVRATNSAGIDEDNIDTKLFQEKMRKMQYTQLPINSFNELAPASDFEQLPMGSDESLLSAIEQAADEYEEDESVRELSLKILTAFRTRNSIEALSQIALYDLSANLRSKAVATLTDFDHEAVFETILLACADPTREVRATAARGLFRLNFDRANAWMRIIETRDQFRMSHAARAALEAGIVTKAFERLIHDDAKIAYEAFVLVALMIEAGETGDIFDAIRGHKDERVKYALLHVVKAVRDERTLDELHDLSKDSSLPTDVMARVVSTMAAFEAVPAQLQTIS